MLLLAAAEDPDNPTFNNPSHITSIMLLLLHVLWLSLVFLVFFRVSHWSDASTTRQCHTPKEQQSPGHHCGFRGGGHRGRGRDCGAHLHSALVRPAKEVRLFSNLCDITPFLHLYSLRLLFPFRTSWGKSGNIYQSKRNPLQSTWSLCSTVSLWTVKFGFSFLQTQITGLFNSH